MKIINIFVIGVVAVLAIIAYIQGGNRHIAGLTTGTKMMLPVLPALLCAFIIAGYMRVLIPPVAIKEWLGQEAGFRGIALGYLGGLVTFGGPFVTFPVAASLYSAGASVSTVTAYITSWALWGGGIIFYELAILGPRLFTIRITACIIFPLLAAVVAGYLAKLW